MDERQRIARLKQQFEHLPPVRVGIGDDAAVLDLPAGELVWTVDCAVEGTHFTRDLLSMHTLGWRSLMAAASDVAAMGAEPLAVLSALQLPPDLRDQQLEQINDGLQAAARAIGTSVAGGNLSSGPCLSITLSVAGTPLRNAVLRSGARPGDTLRLSGPCGVAALGLRALQRAEQAPLASDLEHAVERWRRPRARFDLAPHLAAKASAKSSMQALTMLIVDSSASAKTAVEPVRA